MRYILDTKDEQGIIGIQIAKWEKEEKVDVVEKADPVVELKDRLERVSRALNNLEKAGFDRELMFIYINKKTGVSMGHIKAVMQGQKRFFDVIGVKT